MIINEALMPDKEYESAEVRAMSLERFRKKFDIPLKKVCKFGSCVYTTIPDEESTDRFNTLKKGLVKYISFDGRAENVSAAVVFERSPGIWNPWMELNLYAVRGLGIFYIASEPHVSKKAGIKRIYAHFKNNLSQ